MKRAPGRIELTVHNREIAGRNGAIPVRDYQPANERTGAVPFVWVHGGGFVSGGLDQKESDQVARAIAATGRRVLTIDYRLIPLWPVLGRNRLKPSANRYPAQVIDVEDVLIDYRRSTAGGPLVVGGASAGATLAVSALMRMRDAGLPLPQATVLAYGTYHAKLPPIPAHIAERLRGRHRLQFFTPANVHKMNLNYAGSEELLHHPGTFPGGGPLHGLPPALLLDADADYLRASGEALAAELVAAHVVVSHHVISGTGHGFLDRPGTSGFSDGTRQIAEFLDHCDTWTRANT